MTVCLYAAALLLPLLDPRPPLEDRDRFPPTEIVAAALEDADRYASHIKARMAVELGRADALRECLRDAAWCREAWQLVKAARSDGSTWVGDGWVWIADGRDALARLREHVGPEAYHAARMPPAVPVWRLTPLDP